MAVVGKSSGNTALDEAAVEAAKQNIFTPAIAPGGKPVRVWVMYPVVFKIKG
jgi:TonB family protein